MAILTPVLNNFSIPWELLFRLIYAAFCGILTARERSFIGKKVWMRIHAILAMATAAFMLISIHGFGDFTDKGALGLGGYDPSMIAHQIVNGVAFMGTGLIFKSKRTGVTGMDTAAEIWLTAAIGMACGGGLYLTALFCSLLSIVMNRFFDVQVPFTFQSVEILMENVPSAWQLLERKKQKWAAEIVHSSYQRREGNLVRLKLMLKLQTPIPFEESMSIFDNNPEIKSIST